MTTQKVEDFNLEPAIKARRMMRFEAHTLAEIIEQVHHPNDARLREYAKQTPKEILCTASEPKKLLAKTSPGERVIVHLVLPDKTLVPIGSVLDQVLSKDLWKWLKDNLEQAYPEIVNKIHSKRPPAIWRDGWLCAIPAINQNLSPEILSEAVGRYLWHFAPEIMENNPKIRWLNTTNESLAYALEDTILNQAKVTASPAIIDETIEQIAKKING